MNSSCVLYDWLYIPTESLTDSEIEDVKAQLTVQSKNSYANNPFAKEDKPLKCYSTKRVNYLGVPVDYGLRKFKDRGVVDKLKEGSEINSVTRLPSTNHPSVENPEKQELFRNNLLKAANENYSFLAEAGTGTGKTVCALWVAAQLKRTTLVVVHLTTLSKQWVKEIELHLGVPKSKIGLYSGESKDWIDKDFVVTLYQSLSRENAPKEFYKAFGTVIFDEVHKAGSEQFSKAVTLFPAKYKFGLSATLNRKDGMDTVYRLHLGKVRATSEAEALATTVHALKYQTKRKVTAKSYVARINFLVNDSRRNSFLVNIISRLHSADRKILVVSARVKHLAILYNRCIKAGIPAKDIGFYSGVHPFTNKKFKQEELDTYANNSKILLATYSMVKEGTDIPTLDAGLDATPASEAIQIIGRIRRPLAGKKRPVWYTILDTEIKSFMGYYYKRRKEYLANNVKVIQHDKRY